jgi:glucose-1-phosphate cytidylyltransferase
VKTVILAGGLGTRISEESHLKPKPMINIGDMPILWHIMKMYSAHDINEFVICCGYKGYVIKEYFANYVLHTSDVVLDLKKNKMDVHHKHSEPWKITLVDTGVTTQTGGRLRYIREHLDDTFCLTYGDGVSDINISALIEHHKRLKRKATVTAVQPLGRFGALSLEGDKVNKFYEKPKGDGTWVSGGFFVMEPEVIDFIQDENTVLEQYPLETLADTNELSVYRHTGFWAAMDTLRDRNYLEDLWSKNQAPWRTWE